jgi:hypothetical protein
MEEYIYGHRYWREKYMEYTVEMGSGAVMYLTRHLKTGLVIQKLVGEGYADTKTQTHRQRAW